MEKKRVSIVKTKKNPTDLEIHEAVRRAISLAGGFQEMIAPGYQVLIKPNLVGIPDPEHPGAITNPTVCQAIADLVREIGAHPIIADSSQIGTDTEEVIAGFGYDRLRKMGYEVLDLKKTPVVKVQLPKGKVLTEVSTFDPVMKVDAIVSVPVMKTHDQLEVTLGIKNMKGLVTDENKRLLHREGVIQGVVDLCLTFKPSFTVVDGIMSQEGMGPVYGIPVEMDLIIAGKDPVAVDAVAGRVMGFHPQEVPITVCASERGLGTMEEKAIEMVGESIESVRRRFLRSSEDERVHVKGLTIIHNEGTCTGCRNGVLSSIFDMQKGGKLEYLRDITLMTGPGPSPEGIRQDRFIAVGSCCSREARNFGRFVKGCPPNNIFIIQVIAEMQ